MSDDANTERQRRIIQAEVEIQDAVGNVKTALAAFMEGLPADHDARKRGQVVYDMITNLQMQLVRRVMLGG